MGFLSKVRKIEAGSTEARNLAYRLILDAEKLSPLFGPKKMGVFSLLPGEIKKKSKIILNQNLMTIQLPLPQESPGTMLETRWLSVIKNYQEIALREYKKLFRGVLKKFESLGWNIEYSEIDKVGDRVELFFVSDSFLEHQ